jgi:hypothetical protein
MGNMPYKVGDIIEIDHKEWPHLKFEVVPVFVLVTQASLTLSSFELVDNLALYNGEKHNYITCGRDYGKVYIKHRTTTTTATLDYKLKSKHRF